MLYLFLVNFFDYRKLPSFAVVVKIWLFVLIFGMTGYCQSFAVVVGIWLVVFVLESVFFVLGWFILWVSVFVFMFVGVLVFCGVFEMTGSCQSLVVAVGGKMVIGVVVEVVVSIGLGLSVIKFVSIVSAVRIFFVLLAITIIGKL